MAITISAYKDLYLTAARKLIKEYAHIASSSDDGQTIPTLLRIFHSLKGESLAMGYKNIALLSLEVETLCRMMIKKGTGLDKSLKDSIPFPKVFYDDLDSIENTNSEISLVNETETVQNAVKSI